MTFNGRWPLTEDNLWWKTTFDGRRSLTEDDLWQKTTWWKTTFDRRRPLMEDDLWWKTTFDGRRPLTEDNLQWKTPFDRVTVYHLKKIFTTPHLDSHSTTDPKPEILSAVLIGDRISRDGRNVRGITHVRVWRKDDIFRRQWLNHSEMGKGDYGTQRQTAEPYSCF